MGMYDTFNFNCANCGEETDAQTKLGENCLDYWRLNDETTVEDGCYRVKDECHKCGHRNTVVIVKRHFVAVLKDAPTIAMQEGHWGALLKLDVDFEKYQTELFDEVGKMIKAAAGKADE
jgi:hypothetical protein